MNDLFELEFALRDALADLERARETARQLAEGTGGEWAVMNDAYAKLFQARKLAEEAERILADVFRGNNEAYDEGEALADAASY